MVFSFCVMTRDKPEQIREHLDKVIERMISILRKYLNFNQLTTSFQNMLRNVSHVITRLWKVLLHVMSICYTHADSCKLLRS